MNNRRGLLACGVSVAVLAVSAQAQAQQKNFDIPREPAVQSIPEFARQAGLQIIAPAGQLSGVVTPAIKGQRDARAALRDLLAGTGLTIASDDGAIVALKRSATPGPAADPAGPGRTDDAVSEVLVTGSRIAGSAQDSAAPVAVVNADALVDRSGGVSIGDQLSILPQFRATFTQAASTGIGVYAGVGQVGIDLLDLRGLGPSRTLVLQNGRRLVSSTQQLSQPDTDTIPTELLDRVEILTGGASAIYGADAIAGVVNFVLKDHFEGSTATVRTGISGEGDAATRNISFASGRNFDDGRGNIAGSFAISARDGLHYSDRKFSNGQDYFAPNPLAGQPGQPLEILLPNLHVLAESAGGTLPYGPPYLRFSPDGSLAPTTTGPLTLGSISNGGNGLSTLQDSSLLPDDKRVSFNILGHYDVSDKLTVFSQIDLMAQKAIAYAEPNVTQQLISKTNPYLTAQALSAINSYGPTAAAPSFVVIRSLPELGDAGEEDDRLTLHSVFGAKGQLSDAWKYELSYSYGRTDITTHFLNEYSPTRLNYAINAVRDTAGVLGSPGAIVCAARLAPHAANADIDSCVPADILGDGNISAAARNYLDVNTEAKGLLQQHLFGGFISGDTRDFFRLPAGPVSLVAGFEYRRETTAYDPDPRDLAGLTSNLGAQATKGALRVLEGYSEAKVPLLADLPWAKKLEASASVRVSDYNLTGVGTKTSWGLGLNYQPIEDLRLRASYERAVRAPNIAELYQSAVGTQFYISDPCDKSNVKNGTAYRAANCLALGIPTTYTAPPYGTPTLGSSGGNPNLDVEQGKTWTVGAVFTPHMLPGAAFTIDYYHVLLDNAIISPNPQVIIQQCVDSSSINNVFCAAAPRNPVTHVIQSIAQQPLNLNRLLASGIDFDAAYRFAIPWESQASLRLLGNYVIDRNNYQSPTQPDFPTQIAESMNNPRWTVTFATDLTHGAFTFTHNLRYFSSMYRADPSNFVSVGGLPALHPNLLPSDLASTRNTFFHDIRGSWAFRPGASAYVGIDNLTNVPPPPGVYGAGYGGAIYDNIGRFFYAGLKVSF